ncbi:MAG: hypothetical protein GC153_06105 [Alphaproteobacteria bacterium]|nr:hypothetical protein [Alphaproteobacteria bacterium]
MRREWSVLAAAFLATAAPAGAQDAPNANAANDAAYQNADDYDLDLFSPPGPALLSLDIASRRASAPSTPKDVGYDIGSASGPDGDQYGLALSVMPYWLGARRITLEDYRNNTNALTRIFARSEWSAGGSYISADGDHAWRLGFAMETQLLDAQDHRFDRGAFQCLHEAWNRTRRGEHETAVTDIAKALAENPDMTDEDLLALQQQALSGGAGAGAFDDARRACEDASAARLLAKPSWLIGAGVGLRSDQNRFAGFSYDGVSTWTQYRQPVTKNGRFAFFAVARGDFGRAFDIGLATPVKADAWEAGGGASLQTTRFRLDLSATYDRRNYDGAKNDNFIRYAAIADIKIVRGLWLEGSVGYIDNSLYSSGAFGGVSVKFDFSDFRRAF